MRILLKNGLKTGVLLVTVLTYLIFSLHYAAISPNGALAIYGCLTVMVSGTAFIYVRTPFHFHLYLLFQFIGFAVYSILMSDAPENIEYQLFGFGINAVVLSEKRFRTFVVLVLICILSLIIGRSMEINASGLGNSFDFFLFLTHSIIVFYMINNSITKEKKQLIIDTEKLEKLSTELSLKRKYLSDTTIELHQLKANLENYVEIRTKELEAQNQKLQDFAFVNAHHLRGPICRILGLCLLLERYYKGKIDTSKIKVIKSKANKIDLVVRKINYILN